MKILRHKETKDVAPNLQLMTADRQSDSGLMFLTHYIDCPCKMQMKESS